ncbi:hypothetical protein KUTeg_003234 [Tegillarca granosa]|uniref:AGC-kinase C-terminal domain-containing protein n=1 Tax=Tegillarca granosa TaxID=220873 RepID=A0ABQ9FLJ0_TEGGR|nr:hypothetical protein KUTeg_003234 [Tegillarca granosa]
MELLKHMIPVPTGVELFTYWSGTVVTYDSSTYWSGTVVTYDSSTYWNGTVVTYDASTYWNGTVVTYDSSTYWNGTVMRHHEIVLSSVRNITFPHANHHQTMNYNSGFALTNYIMTEWGFPGFSQELGLVDAGSPRREGKDHEPCHADLALDFLGLVRIGPYWLWSERLPPDWPYTALTWTKQTVNASECTSFLSDSIYINYNSISINTSEHRPIGIRLITCASMDMTADLVPKSRKDVSNFDREFTSEAPKMTPTDKLFIMNLDQTEFHGFSFVNPEFIFLNASL